MMKPELMTVAVEIETSRMAGVKGMHLAGFGHWLCGNWGGGKGKI